MFTTSAQVDKGRTTLTPTISYEKGVSSILNFAK